MFTVKELTPSPVVVALSPRYRINPPVGFKGHYHFNEMDTAFDALPAHRPPNRVSMSVPIVLPCTGFTKKDLEFSGKRSAALVTKVRSEDVYSVCFIRVLFCLFFNIGFCWHL